MSYKIAINGFGRIGRLFLRAALNQCEVEVVAINDLMDPATIAHLLQFDSVHGRLKVEVTAHEGAIEVCGKRISVTGIKYPAELPWRSQGVDIVAECTGLFSKRQSAAKHLAAGARKVIVSAPSGDVDATIVMGVNHSQYDPRKHDIISNASCTTNCLAPVAKVLDENFSIQTGLMTTIHSYTGDQRLLDFPHKDLRRARAAALSMIPTSTGAAQAVALVLPELAGKLNGLAIRVPTPNVSLVDFVAALGRTVTPSEVNAALKEASFGDLRGIMGFSELPLVSTDFNGCPLSSVVDGPMTQVVGNMVKVLAWYDNETGYSTRMVELAAMIGKQLL
ncbi:MAG: type I glyceraldehyde-3-phosphate dehydrogenase [Desulfoprunum sp.]|nr:type I glyceraldehyde-3-phosphate dehydrogenase [Desulfoprunum sp.]